MHRCFRLTDGLLVVTWAQPWPHVALLVQLSFSHFPRAYWLGPTRWMLYYTSHQYDRLCCYVLLNYVVILLAMYQSCLPGLYDAYQVTVSIGKTRSSQPI